MRKILALVAMLGLDVDPTMAAALFDERAKKFTAGYDFLQTTQVPGGAHGL